MFWPNEGREDYNVLAKGGSEKSILGSEYNDMLGILNSTRKIFYNY